MLEYILLTNHRRGIGRADTTTAAINRRPRHRAASQFVAHIIKARHGEKRHRSRVSCSPLVDRSSGRHGVQPWPRSARRTHIFFEMGPRPTSGNMLFVSAYYRAGLRAVVRAHGVSLDVVDRVNLCGWYGRGPNRLARSAPRGNWQRERHRFALRESVAHTPPNPPEFQKENSVELVSEQKKLRFAV